MNEKSENEILLLGNHFIKTEKFNMANKDLFILYVLAKIFFILEILSFFQSTAVIFQRNKAG